MAHEAQPSVSLDVLGQQEALRLFPSVPHFARTTSEDCYLGKEYNDDMLSKVMQYQLSNFITSSVCSIMFYIITRVILAF